MCRAATEGRPYNQFVQLQSPVTVCVLGQYSQQRCHTYRSRSFLVQPFQVFDHLIGIMRDEHLASRRQKRFNSFPRIRDQSRRRAGRFHDARGRR